MKMKMRKQKGLITSTSLIIGFVLLTLAVRFVDVQMIGPGESSVGFATINRYIHNLTGVNMHLYNATDWLSLVPLGIIIGFALIGICQWVKRKHILKVDYSILALGGFYILVMGVYLLFELLVINYRPVLINGNLESSYPSSTTMLVLCVMPTAMMQAKARIKNLAIKRCIFSLITAFTVFMVVGRFISGVHWFTDILGGTILSAGLVMMYRYIINKE